MKAFAKIVRVTLVTLASAGTAIPSSAWAKGPGGHPSSSHNSSSLINQVNNSNSTTALKLKTSNVTPAPNGNTGFTGIGVSKNLSTNFGSPNGGGSSLGVFSSTSKVNQKATNSGIIIIGGKNDALSTTVKPGDMVSLNPQPLPPKVITETSNGRLSSAILNNTSTGSFGTQGPGSDHNSQMNILHAPNYPVTNVTVGEKLSDSAAGALDGSHTGFTGRHPTSQSNNSQDSGAEQITKTEETYPFVDHTPKLHSNPQATKIPALGTTLQVKPLVDQEVQTGPKLPGGPVMLSALSSSVSAGVATTTIANKPIHLDSASGDSTKGSSTDDGSLTHNTHHNKHGKKDDNQTSSQAVKDAQAAADKADQAYIDAQNKASQARANLGSAEAQEGQAKANLQAAGDAYSKNPNDQTLQAFDQAQNDYNLATYKVTLAAEDSTHIDQQVAAATVAKNQADANLATAQAAQAQSAQSKSHSDFPSKIIPAANGNTGFTGIGLPSSGGSSVMSADAPDYSAGSYATASSTTANVPNTATVKPIASGADLALEDVRLVAPATMIAGPAYAVTFRNQGTVAANNFQLAMLVGLDGKLADNAPRAVIQIGTLAAGEAKEVTLRLPQSAMKLAGADGKLTAFTQLFVAVDLMNTVAETDETNNTAVVDRAALEATAAN